MKNTLSITAIIGITVAILVIITGIFASIFYLQKTYPLYFQNKSGIAVNGDVFLNGEYIGKTQNGKVFIEEFTTGEVKIIVHINENSSYENYFEITPSYKDSDFTFVVDPKINPLTNTTTDFKDDYLNYLNAIQLNNKELRLEATTATSYCLSGDKECQLIGVYEHVLSGYKYFADARDDEHIQSPLETKQFGGGDCEDLTILLNSLLENIGIETYIVFTEDHVYSLACDINSDVLYDYTLYLFYQTENVENSTTELTLKGGETWYYGGDENYPGNLLSIVGNINSDRPILLFAVDNEKDFQGFMNDDDYSVIEGTYFENIKNKDFEYVISDCGGFIIYNPNPQTVSINLKLDVNASYFSITPEDIKITTYNINNKICVPLDPSAGEWSYAGYDTSNDITEKIFINTLTRKEDYASK